MVLYFYLFSFQSPYFASMFSGSWNESGKSQIKIDLTDQNITEDGEYHFSVFKNYYYRCGDQEDSPVSSHSASVGSKNKEIFSCLKPTSSSDGVLTQLLLPLPEAFRSTVNLWSYHQNLTAQSCVFCTGRPLVKCQFLKDFWKVGLKRVLLVV